jgi:hypothetical protein
MSFVEEVESAVVTASANASQADRPNETDDFGAGTLIGSSIRFDCVPTFFTMERVTGIEPALAARLAEDHCDLTEAPATEDVRWGQFGSPLTEADTLLKSAGSTDLAGVPADESLWR